MKADNVGRIFVLCLMFCAFVFVAVSYSDHNDPPKQISFAEALTFNDDDPRLLRYISGLIESPSGADYTLINKTAKDFSQFKQQPFLEQLFKYKRRGTFIEVGAYDGENYSNTLHLEKELDWTGLLIEANPMIYYRLKSKNRRTPTIEAGVSPSRNVEEITYELQDTMSYGAGANHVRRHTQNLIGAKCFPLYSFLLAADLTTLDVLSIDIEGYELKALKSLPWDKIDIHVVMVEWNLIPEGELELNSFMEGKGYTFIKQLDYDNIFVKKGYKF